MRHDYSNEPSVRAFSLRLSSAALVTALNNLKAEREGLDRCIETIERLLKSGTPSPAMHPHGMFAKPPKDILQND